jgi:hypothetical protein
LYQKWIYPVDKKRTNEFGTTGDGSGPVDEDQPAIEPNVQEAAASSQHPKSE